jgi:hypothetical protein
VRRKSRLSEPKIGLPPAHAATAWRARTGRETACRGTV